MRQLINKEAYEAPLTTKRVVTMEGNCMAASGDPMKESTVSITAGEQDDNSQVFDLSENGWE